LRGLIPGKSFIEVEIEYFAKTASTAIVEVELNISQFNFEPMTIRIMGSGKYEGVDMELTRKRTKKIERPTANDQMKTMELEDEDLVETRQGFRKKNKVQ
jgi:hypothetical protein